MIGKTISHYKILEKLGAGGMGVVYKAEDTKLKRTVALKFLPREYSTDIAAKERFIHEARAASALDHPNICNIHEIRETDEGQSFIAMAYYQGQSLKSKIEEGKLKIEEAVEYVIQIAKGLKRAHDAGIIHRDIKPANIIITEHDEVKLLDFGLAKLAGQTRLTKEGMTVGTVAYMSPEQARGVEVDQRTDIWSLGVVMYEMITGKLPFKGDYDQAIIYSILNEDPEPIALESDDIPLKVTRIITKALAKDPENRYQTIGDLLSDFKTYGSKDYEYLTRDRLKFLKKHFTSWKISILGSLILMFAAIIYFINPFESDDRRLESLAVLPFGNYTGNNELEYFIAGMHSSLIGDIGKISALRVISKTTSNAYKNVEKSIPEIASELNVDAIIETSVLSLGDSIRLQIKLVDVYPKEKQLWIQDYYEAKSQILNLYNKVTKEISEEINIILTPQEESLLAESRAVNTEAYDAYMKGQYYWDRLGKEDLEKAMEYFNIAIEKDPNWAPPYAGLSEVWIGRMQMGFALPTIAIPKIYENLNKALELDPNFANSHYVKALMAVWTEWNWEKGETEFLKSIELNPNNALCRVYYAHLLMTLRRSDEALRQAKLALELDPLKPLVMTLYGVVMMNEGDFSSAIIQTEKALAIEPGHFFATAILEYASYYKGDYEKAFIAANQIIPFKKETVTIINKTYKEQGYIPALKVMINDLEEFTEAGLYLPFDLAERYMRLKEYEKAIEWIEKGYVIHDPNMPYITTIFFDDDILNNNPRFLEILRKLELPLH